MAGDIPTDLAGILSALGLPAGALALGYGLVKGADALEADAKEERLKNVSDLLKRGPLTSFGPLGAAVVPFIFDKAFGQLFFVPTSAKLKFMFRSFLASITFWVLLILIKHPNWRELWVNSFVKSPDVTFIFALNVLGIDLASLVKARIILTRMLRKDNISWTVVFVIMDVTLTLIMLVFVMGVYYILLSVATYMGEYVAPGLFGPSALSTVNSYKDAAIEFITLIPVFSYFRAESIDDLTLVFISSTLLTSVWVTLFLISSFIVGLLAPLEYLRRFTIWWFKDIDAHPLRAIAKVAATLIVVVAFILKAVRWGWLLV
jgi:hypothetical protein